MFRLIPLNLVALALVGGWLFAEDDPKKGTPEEAAKRELDKLQGAWVCVGYEKAGKQDVSQQARESRKNETLWIRGDRATITHETKAGGTGSGGVLKLFPATDPKGIDLVWESGGPEKNLGKTQPGVYALDGDKLRICWSEVGSKDRPNGLKTKEGDKRTVLLYERKK